MLGVPSGPHPQVADASATCRGCVHSNRGKPYSRTPCSTASGQAAQPSLVSLASWQPPPATTVPSSRPKAAVLLAGTEHAEAVLEARLLKAEGLHCDAHRSEMAAVAANAFEGHLQLHAVKKRSHWDVGVGGCSSQRPGLEKPKADLWLDVVVHQEGTSCAEVNRHGLYAWLPTDEAGTHRTRRGWHHDLVGVAPDRATAPPILHSCPQSLASLGAGVLSSGGPRARAPGWRSGC
mmetsp:Transcript_72100/g.234269  ORF Transcript_72100/g.234269 Transcript_72100/m.234269 type:complete len:235 (-) Transcript_72100:214-918(-)